MIEAFEPAKNAWQILGQTFLFVLTTAAIIVVVWWIISRYLRPTESDLYCCGCAGRECGWGCCHRSCIDHDPDAIEEAAYFSEWVEMREQTPWS